MDKKAAAANKKKLNKTQDEQPQSRGRSPAKHEEKKRVASKSKSEVKGGKASGSKSQNRKSGDAKKAGKKDAPKQ